MKTQYMIIGLILSAFLFLGCTQNPQNNLDQNDGSLIASEVDAGWIEDTSGTGNDMVATDQEVISNEATPLDENDTIAIGDMV